MDFSGKLDLALERLHQEGRYRTFIDIERRCGHFPHAVWRKPDGSEQQVTVWCGNDYLGMGQHPAVLSAMHEALDSVEAVVGDGPGALVITGSGKAFSVGLNVPVVMQYAPEKIEVFNKALKKLFGRLMNFKMPTVAAINGHAFAAGAFLTLACDYRVMRNDRGWCCFSEVDVGVPIGAAEMAMAKDKLSASVCRDAVLTGKRYTSA